MHKLFLNPDVVTNSVRILGGATEQVIRNREVGFHFLIYLRHPSQTYLWFLDGSHYLRLVDVNTLTLNVFFMSRKQANFLQPDQLFFLLCMASFGHPLFSLRNNRLTWNISRWNYVWQPSDSKEEFL